MAQLSTYAADSATAREFERLSNGDVITDATTARTLALTDTGRTINMTSSSANTVTVPPNASVAFRIGAEITVRQAGTGATTLVAGSGVTLEQPASDTLVLAERYAVATVKKLATNTWAVIGRMTAV